MKNELIILLFLVFLISIQSQMTIKERENLFKKYTKRIGKDFESVFNKPKSFYHDEYFRKYDPSKINNIIDKYKFPLNYNFFKETNCTPIIKNQEYCGSCWAFASTSALAYRYHKIGIDVSLSPQYLLSCYLNECDAGDYVINAQFALVTYGTVTEECFPYSSGDGEVIDECPSKCKNDEEFKIYYAKNAYSTEMDYYNGDYYDIVAIIMDQLINYGPVVTTISDYEDFDDLYYSDNCTEIYKYNGYSNYSGEHAIVIAGYGYEDSKFYWIIQNSWGTEFCGNGLAKVEFGEIGIERVSFSEPYIPEGNKTDTKTIDVKLTLKQDCSFEFNTGSEEIKESFQLYFQNVDDPDSELYYQCNLSPVGNNKNEGICNYKLQLIFETKGYFKYKNYSSIRNEYKYNLDFSSLPEKDQFYFYGIDFIDYMFDYNIYVSEEGSAILLYYESEDDLGLLSKIYPNENIETALNNCTIIPQKTEMNYSLVYCKLKQKEINYFENNEDLPLTYDLLCGIKEPIDAYVYKLDKTKYPVFKVKYFVLPEEKCKENECNFILVVNIEGSISEFTEGNEFFGLVNMNNSEYIETKDLYCQIPKPSIIQDYYEIPCYFFYETENNIESYSFELTPYFCPFSNSTPFEIFSENKIKSIEYEEYQKLKEKNKKKPKSEILLSIIKNPIFIALSCLLLLILLKLFVL